MSKKIQIIILAVAIVVVAVAGSFYGGMLYKGSQAGQRGQNQGLRTGGRFTSGNNFVAGDVVAKDNQSITIKMRDGSSRIIFYSTTTEVSKFVAGDINDVAVGKTIMVNGKTNSDGSITAQSLQIRPAQSVNQLK